MNKITRLLLIILTISATITSCRESLDSVSEVTPSKNNNTNISARIAEDEQQVLRKEFGLALAKALEESKELRILLRTKALEMIDEDYDVLFALIRDEVLVDKLTVRELIAKYLKNKERLDQIEFFCLH